MRRQVRGGKAGCLRRSGEDGKRKTKRERRKKTKRK